MWFGGTKAVQTKKCEDTPKDAPLWMVTYGDFMRLLLTFFVLILSSSAMHGFKFMQVLKGFLGVMACLESTVTQTDIVFPKLIPKG